MDVRYDQKPALYTNQFMIHSGPEDIILDCVSGLEVRAGRTLFPVHTKLALSWGAAERLHSLLSETLQQRPQPGGAIPAPHLANRAAKLPAFGDPSV